MHEKENQNNNKKVFDSYALEIWKSDFGKEYHIRNQVNWNKRIPFYKKIFSIIMQRGESIKTIIEIGAGCGPNLLAIKNLYPTAKLYALEPNSYACNVLKKTGLRHIIKCSIEEYNENNKFDLVLTSGVLIHIPPQNLIQVYRRIYDLAVKYILINEYFSPEPMEITYRGRNKLLFKRDFGGDMLDLYGSQIELVDYGFLYKRVEEVWDNTTWWLFRKLDKK